MMKGQDWRAGLFKKRPLSFQGMKNGSGGKDR
jgi:hypothetical protein